MSRLADLESMRTQEDTRDRWQIDLPFYVVVHATMSALDRFMP